MHSVDGPVLREVEQDDVADASDFTINDRPRHQLVTLMGEPKNQQQGIEKRVRRKLKWGVVAHSLAILETENGERRPIAHLSFGTEGEYAGLE